MTLGEVAYNEFESWMKPELRRVKRTWLELTQGEREAWQLAALAVIANRHDVEPHGPTAYGLLGGR